VKTEVGASSLLQFVRHNMAQIINVESTIHKVIFFFILSLLNDWQ